MEERRYKLAVFASHPAQYHAPFYRALARHPSLDVTVLYGSRRGTGEFFDPGFGRRIRWDIDVLEGYRSQFLRNWALFPTTGSFWGLFNPGILPLLARGRWDALLVHGYSHLSCWLAILAARLCRTRCLFRGETVLAQPRSHSPARLKGIALRWLFRRTAACLAIGSKSQEFYRAYGVREDQIVWCPYTIDADRFIQAPELAQRASGALRRRLSIPEGPPVVLCVSKWIPRKRPLDLLRAALSLSSPSIVVLVGEGALRPELEALARRHPDRIRLVGFRNQSELPSYYAMADLFVLPSSYEPWGIVINEAMCAGLPIVTTTAVAAAADLVHHGENGFLYSPGEVGQLAGFLRTLAEDPELRIRMGRNSLERIRAWTPEASAEGVVEALSRCAS